MGWDTSIAWDIIQPTENSLDKETQDPTGSELQ